jgi:hypothetical protein
MSDFAKAGQTESLRVRRLRRARVLALEAAIVSELIERQTPREQWVGAIQEIIPGAKGAVEKIEPRVSYQRPNWNSVVGAPSDQDMPTGTVLLRSASLILPRGKIS